MAAAVQDTSRLANTSRRKARVNAHPPRRRCRSVRFTPTAATSIVTSMSETQRPRGNPSVPETPSRRPSQKKKSRECTCRNLEEIVQGIGTLHFDGRRIDMHLRKLQNTENDKVINVYVSNRLCAREGESPDRGRSFQCARREQLSAVSTFERVYGVDISHDNCGHRNLPVW